MSEKRRFDVGETVYYTGRWLISGLILKTKVTHWESVAGGQHGKTWYRVPVDDRLGRSEDVLTSPENIHADLDSAMRHAAGLSLRAVKRWNQKIFTHTQLAVQANEDPESILREINVPDDEEAP